MNPRGLFASLFRQKPKADPDSPDPIYDSLVRLFASDKFPEIIDIYPDWVHMAWDEGLLVTAQTGRFPKVTASSNNCNMSYNYDQMLVDKAFHFAHRADATRDRSTLVRSINKIIQ